MLVPALAALLAVLLLAGCGTPADAIDIVAQVVGDAEAGVPVTITLKGPVGKPGEFSLPHVDGLTVNGTGGDPNTNPPSYNFFVTPAHAGDYTIPAFDVRSDDGKTYHVQALTLHVTGG
jgi:hypothetical protein